MKAKYVYPSLILLMLTFSGLFGIATAAEAQDVHALLIILGNDSNIRESVEKNEEKITNMLKQLSYRCNVHLTLMYSKGEREGSIISQKMYVKGGSQESAKETPADIIKSRQVVEWLENLKPKSEDTIFVYYNGHGEIDSFNTHSLIFDPGVRSDTPDRDKLSEKLKQKPARLRMLITDTCSSPSEDLSDDTFAKFSVEVRPRARSYLQNLFLEHEGFLDITAAAPGQFAIGNSDLGGHFTSALLSQGFTAAAMTGKDDFLSWQEAFEKTKTQTQELYGKAVFGPQMERDLQKNKQNTQEPYAYSPLPTRIGGGGSSVTGRDGGEMVLIPAGEFQMGSDDGRADEKPVHTVYVDAFYMDKYEVTNAQYKRFIDANPKWRKDSIADRFHNGNYLGRWSGNDYPNDRADHPVVDVSWYAAMAYAEWAGKHLPTEAEWEKAARGGLVGKKYPWGDTINASKANYDNDVGSTTPVGSYAPNDYGLYDMGGNVWEWCLDEWDAGFYASSPRRNPVVGGSITHIKDNYTNVNSSRVLRGGSWFSFARLVRVAYRYGDNPSNAFSAVGFRCARTVTP